MTHHLGTYSATYATPDLMAGSLMPTVFALCAVVLIGACLIAAVREWRT